MVLGWTLRPPALNKPRPRRPSLTRVPPSIRAYAPACKRLGRTDYTRTWRAMQAFTDARTPDARRDLADRARAGVRSGSPVARAHAARQCDSGAEGRSRARSLITGRDIGRLLIDLKRLRLGVQRWSRRSAP
jgi:hypothetical protein